MSNADFLIKVAAVLELVAEQVDAEEIKKAEVALNERKTTVSSLSKKYAEATGEELPTDIAEKLASVDVDLVGFVNGLIEKQAGVVDALGVPSKDTSDDAEPSSAKEAAAQAEDKLLNWILS